MCIFPVYVSGGKSENGGLFKSCATGFFFRCVLFFVVDLVRRGLCLWIVIIVIFNIGMILCLKRCSFYASNSTFQ